MTILGSFHAMFDEDRGRVVGEFERNRGTKEGNNRGPDEAGS